MNNLGVELTATVIEGELLPYALSRASGKRQVDLGQRVQKVSSTWLASVERELLAPAIQRRESATLVKHVSAATDDRVVFLVGTAGAGKSAVLSQGLRNVEAAGMPVLGFRLDRLEAFTDTQALGEQLGLTTSPVAALAANAGDAPCLLVVDQLDAVSLASGRMPNSFDAVSDLVREAAAFPNMRIVLACRQFDVDNDNRIRGLGQSSQAKTIQVSALSDEEVDAAVTAMGLDSTKLKPSQRSLLRAPLHLVLLASVADQPHALNFDSTAHLFDAYWTAKRRAARNRKGSLRFSEVIARVANSISDQQRLSVSDTVLDQGELADDADVLISEHILVRDGHQIAFFHESFFDYAFARQWAGRGQTFVDFLVASEQELFRRSQVRQIMHHLRQREPDRFLVEVENALSSPAVRFHIKETILAVLSGLSKPSTSELRMVVAIAEAHADLADRTWQLLRVEPWFDRMDEDGQLTAWLDSDVQAERHLALTMLGTAARTEPDRVAEILSAYDKHVEYAEWLRWVVRFANLHTSRKLFDLLIDGISKDVYVGWTHELWLATHGLAEREPEWAIELLQAYFARPDALSLNESGKVSALADHEYGASEMIKNAASARPALFVGAMLPYMKDVMRIAVSGDPQVGLPDDRHFSYFYGDMISNNEVDDAMLLAMRDAIEAIVVADQIAARPVLEGLAHYPYSSAQWLLYHGLIAGSATYADWAAELLLEGVNRLFCGSQSNSVWVARLLLQAILPHIDDDKHELLEDAVRDLRFEWESHRSGGWYAFNLLSALDPTRLTELGRRRLGEYQRKFNIDQPAEPEDLLGGSIQSPISSDATPHMTDENWLQAMARHAVDRSDWSNFKGGARELSHLLQQQTAADPLRFAKLGLQLSAGTHPVYGGAILMGLADSPVQATDQTIVFDCVRHIATLGHPDNDRWLGYALRQYWKSAPLDLVEIVRDRALAASDPVNDRAFSTSETERKPGENLRVAGMNSARGSLAEELGNLLVYDVDGSRTAAVAPVLRQLATDPVLSVRTQVAHTIAATLRFNRDKAVEAFWALIDTDDAVFTAAFVQDLVIYIGNGESAPILPVIGRMLTSADATVRECGGRLAAYAALEWSSPRPLETVMASADRPSREGVASICAQRLSATRNAGLAGATLIELFGDASAPVRKAAATVAAALRKQKLHPFEQILLALVDSASFEEATPQLFLTIEYAPDRVDRLALRTAQRYIEVFGAAAGDMRTGAAADAKYVSDLVIRGLAQTRDRAQRAALLDVVDELVKVGAYGVDEAIESAAR